jgi:hypothetical protein
MTSTTSATKVMCLAIAVAAAASGQMTAEREMVSLSDVRPLQKVAAYATSRYGIPVAYEDLPASAYSGGLPAASTV